MSILSDLLNNLNQKAGGLSSRQIQARAAEHGHKLHYSTVSVYLRGEHGIPSQAILQAWADVYGVDVALLRNAAFIPIDDYGPFDPGPEAHRLTPSQRRTVRMVIRAILNDEPDNWADGGME